MAAGLEIDFWPDLTAVTDTTPRSTRTGSTIVVPRPTAVGSIASIRGRSRTTSVSASKDLPGRETWNRSLRGRRSPLPPPSISPWIASWSSYSPRVIGPLRAEGPAIAEKRRSEEGSPLLTAHSPETAFPRYGESLTIQFHDSTPESISGSTSSRLRTASASSHTAKRSRTCDAPQAVTRRHHESAIDEWGGQPERVCHPEPFLLDDKPSVDIE